MAAVAASGSAAGAQVQITFYDTFPSTAPDPTQPFPGGAVFCTAAAAGTATGFTLNFGLAATRALLCPGDADRLNPLGNTFGARITGSIVAPSAGTYSLTLNSDDGDRLSINGAVAHTSWVIKSGGPGLIGSINLLAGANPFVFDYYQGAPVAGFAQLEVGGGLTLTPPGSPTSMVPEPRSLLLTATGAAVVALSGRRRRRTA